MSPVEVLVWSCVVIFIVTGILTILHVSGLYQLPDRNHGKVLFRALILEIVVITTVAFAGFINKPVETKKSEEQHKTFQDWWGKE